MNLMLGNYNYSVNKADNNIETQIGLKFTEKQLLTAKISIIVANMLVSLGVVLFSAFLITGVALTFSVSPTVGIPIMFSSLLPVVILGLLGAGIVVGVTRIWLDMSDEEFGHVAQWSSLKKVFQ